MERNRKMNTYICVTESLCYTPEHYKFTILQWKNKNKKLRVVLGTPPLAIDIRSEGGPGDCLGTL